MCLLLSRETDSRKFVYDGENILHVTDVVSRRCGARVQSNLSSGRRFPECPVTSNLPDPPFYVINRANGRCLELGGDGTYAACRQLLQELRDVFGATCREHLESHEHPDCGRGKGYWIVEMFGQEFFLMRQSGGGICLWGPQPPADVQGFLRVAQHFGAREHVTTWGRIARRLAPWRY